MSQRAYAKPKDVVSTTDMAIASYWFANGLHVVKLEPKVMNGARTRDARMYFKDPDSRASELALEYANSESRRFDEAQRTLKKLIAQERRNW